jgi:protein-S-isoprenylcysteine O-methyltransferase Ste14
MSPVLVMRVLFGLLLVNEAVVFLRSSADEKKQIIYPRWMPLPMLLLLAPFAWSLAFLPTALGWCLAALQGLGLALEVRSELQLMRARSFSIVPRSPAQPQVKGSYRFLENPIYVGMLLQLLAWGAIMPLAWVGAALNYEALRKMVRAERAHLKTLGFEHRGVDSFLWS